MSDAEQDLIEWARVNRDRDRRVRRALAEGISKNRIHTITGISRATIDRLLTKESDMTTTTEYGTWANYDGSRLTVEDTVADYLGCTVQMNPRIRVLDGEFADDYDFDALVDAYRDEVNNALVEDISLRGNEFYGPSPRRDGAAEEIRAAIEAVDLGELAQRFDRSAG